MEAEAPGTRRCPLHGLQPRGHGRARVLVHLPLLGRRRRHRVRRGRLALPTQPPRERVPEDVRVHRGCRAQQRVTRSQSAHTPASPAPPRVHRRVYPIRTPHAHPRHRARQRGQTREVPRRSRRDQAHDPEQAAQVRGSRGLGRHGEDARQAHGAGHGLPGGVHRGVSHLPPRAQRLFQRQQRHRQTREAVQGR